MARPGPAPKPSRLRILEGNPGHKALNREEPKPRPIAPRCPSWLAREAKREWRRVAPVLERLGLLTEVDGAALAAYCQAYARWRAAEEAVSRLGATYTTALGRLAPRPEVAMARQMMGQVRAFCAEFGLTPSARGRMSIPAVPDDDPDNPFDV